MARARSWWRFSYKKQKPRCYTKIQTRRKQVSVLFLRDKRKFTFSLSRVGWCKVWSQTLPRASIEYVSLCVDGCFNILSNFFWPGPHSCFAKWRLPIKDQASGWSWNTHTNKWNLLIWIQRSIIFPHSWLLKKFISYIYKCFHFQSC